MARRLSRSCSDRYIRGALQEHAPFLLSERQQPSARNGRHRRRGGLAGARHRHRLAYGRHGGQADEAHGVQSLQRGVQEDLPQGQALRHRTLAGGHCARTRDDDPLAADRRRHGAEHEDRRRGVSGRQDQGDLLLHRRRARGFPRANQGLRRTVSHPHRNETDRRPPGSGTHRRHRSLRPRTVLRIVDLEFLECDDQLGPYAGDLPQPPKTGRTVLETQVLPRLRIRHLRGRPQGVPPSAGTAPGSRRRILPGQNRHPGRYHVLQQQQGYDDQRGDASRRPRQR